MEAITIFFTYGVLHWPVSYLILFVIASAFLTLLAVTCFLHRSQTHRSINLSAPVNHFFRFVLFIFTGMVTKEWVSVHRKHHALCDTKEDPHSPRHHGLAKVFFQGAELYRLAGKDEELLKIYGEGTPNDWLERNLYTKYPALGISLTLVAEIILFGASGLAIWAFQMMVVPVIAAGFINGIAHVIGTQRYKDGDERIEGGVYQRIGDAKNVPTFGLAVGEEFHNNHHAYQSRYKFSHEWYEFDIGGTVLEILCLVRLAEVPKPR